MSAYRDRTQGVAFLYKNLFDLYMKSKKENNGKGIIPEPVDVMVFRPREKGETLSPIRKTQIKNINNPDMDSIQSKLNDLKEVHSRLKTMISEINEMVDKKKKDS